MAPRKKSRTVSRSKPALSNITNTMNAVQLKEHKFKVDLIVEDFKKNIDSCVAQCKEEQEQVVKSVQEIYNNFRHQLLPLKDITVAQLLQSAQKKRGRKKKDSENVGDISTVIASLTMKSDCMEDDNEEQTQEVASTEEQKDVSDQSESVPLPIIAECLPMESTSNNSRMSDISSLLAETTKKMSKVAVKQKGNVAASATRASSRKRKPPGFADDGLMPAPSTTRPVRSKKVVEGAAFVTPAGQRLVTHAIGARLMVTPKFDPRFPLPVGTVRRRPMPNEVPISLTGSPLKISPPKTQSKEIISNFLKTLSKEVPQVGVGELQKFQAVLDRYIEKQPNEH